MNDAATPKIDDADWQVPDHRTDEFGPRRSKYCVSIFVINENGKLHKQLDRMREISKSIDVVLADGGSTDGSTEPGVLRSFGVNTLLTKTGPGKLGAQMRMAFAWALRRGYEGVISIDGNNKDSVENIPDFIAKLDDGFDHVQGSRFIPGGVSENLPLSRWLGVKLLHVPMMRWASGFSYTDTTNGFRAYSARLLQDPRVRLFRHELAGYELHYYLALKAPRLGLRTVEIPVARRYPAHGKVPTKISPLRGNMQVIQRLIAVCRGKYDPPA